MEINSLKITFLTLLLISGTLISSFSQEEMKSINDSDFKIKMRPDTVFNHDDHNENAEIEDCASCHHLYEDGKLVEEESSEDKECSECHGSPAGKSRLELIKTFHTSCRKCHFTRKKGPVLCGECHPGK